MAVSTKIYSLILHLISGSDAEQFSSILLQDIPLEDEFFLRGYHDGNFGNRNVRSMTSNFLFDKEYFDIINSMENNTRSFFRPASGDIEFTLYSNL